MKSAINLAKMAHSVYPARISEKPKKGDFPGNQLSAEFHISRKPGRRSSILAAFLSRKSWE
jgi:hypothetical protein